jgi:glycosyltransferase involved in cell wall biosynthesis
VSQRALDDTLRYAPELASRLFHVPNGVLAPATDDIDPVPGRIAAIGRLTPQKGFDVALAAMSLVRNDHPSARLTLAGVGPDEASLRGFVESHELTGSVEFLGRIPQESVRQLMARSSIVLMPSRYEGLPLVALEAAWAARPVVGTDVPGLNEAVAHGVTGVLVPSEDPDALAAAVVGLLDDAERRRDLGRAARERAERLYGLSNCVDTYLDLYDQAIRHRLGQAK